MEISDFGSNYDHDGVSDQSISQDLTNQKKQGRRLYSKHEKYSPLLIETQQDTQNKDSLSKLERIKQGLKGCKGNSGILNPIKAFNYLNTFQKEEDPNAY